MFISLSFSHSLSLFRFFSYFTFAFHNFRSLTALLLLFSLFLSIVVPCCFLFLRSLCSVLNQHTHGHSHSPHQRQRRPPVERIQMTKKLITENHNGVGPVTMEVEEIKITGLDDGDAREGAAHKRRNGRDTRNINVRAAFVHSIGDLFKSFGVVIAGYIIKFKVGERMSDQSLSPPSTYQLHKFVTHVHYRNEEPQWHTRCLLQSQSLANESIVR